MLPALSFVSQEKQIKGLPAVGNASTFNDFLRFPQFTPTPARISVGPIRSFATSFKPVRFNIIK